LTQRLFIFDEMKINSDFYFGYVLVCCSMVSMAQKSMSHILHYRKLLLLRCFGIFIWAPCGPCGCECKPVPFLFSEPHIASNQTGVQFLMVVVCYSICKFSGTCLYCVSFRVFQYQPKWSNGKNFSEITYFCVEWNMKTLTWPIVGVGWASGMTSMSSHLLKIFAAAAKGFPASFW